MGEFIAGIEIGGTKLQLFLAEACGEVVERQRFNVNREAGAAGIRAQIEQQIREWQKRGVPITALGAGFGGPINWQTGRVATSHQIEGWSGFEFKSWLERISGTRCFVDNDSNLAGLAEALSGAGSGFQTVFYTNFGSGVGGALVQNGRLYHGAFPGECEFGHLRLDMTGATVESRCSGWAVDQQIRNLPEGECNGKLWQLAQKSAGGESRWLIEALESGDPAAERIFSELCENIAFALSHVTHLFHPEVVVIGGGLSGMGEPFRARIEKTLPEWLMEVFKPGPQIRLARHGEDVVPIGALHLAGWRGAVHGE